MKSDSAIHPLQFLANEEKHIQIHSFQSDDTSSQMNALERQVTTKTLTLTLEIRRAVPRKHADAFEGRAHG